MRCCKKRGSSYLVYAFNTMWYLIGLISALDVYYAIKFQKMLLETEKNPAGIFLIEIANGDVSLFIGCKVAGTVIVLGILQNAFLVCDKQTRFAFKLTFITFCVTLFQIWLLYYLHK